MTHMTFVTYVNKMTHVTCVIRFNRLTRVTRMIQITHVSRPDLTKQANIANKKRK